MDISLTNYNRLKANLEELGLTSFSSNIDFYLDKIKNDEKTLIDALYEMSEKEKSLRTERQARYSVKTAAFPYPKTIEDYDFSFQPSLNKSEIEDYCSFRFIENKENIVFIGSCGVGKNASSSSYRHTGCNESLFYLFYNNAGFDNSVKSNGI